MCRKIQFLMMIYVQTLNFNSTSECLDLKLKYASEVNVLFVSISIILCNAPINVCVYLCTFLASLAVHLEMKKGREKQYCSIVHQNNRYGRKIIKVVPTEERRRKFRRYKRVLYLSRVGPDVYTYMKIVCH